MKVRQKLQMEGNAVAENIDTPPGTIVFGSSPAYEAPVADGGFSISGDLHWLPPKSVWLIDAFDEKSKIPTPVDERGLVVPELLIEHAKGLVDVNYQWPFSELSVHHLFWKGYWYNFPSSGQRAREFRELPVHKILVPRIFENWVHQVTIPPDVPSEDVMDHRIESWGVAKNLFKSIRNVVQWDRRFAPRREAIESKGIILPEEYEGEDIIGQEILNDTVNRHFRGVERHMSRLHGIEPSLRLVEPAENLTSPEQRNLYAKKLGSVVVPRALPMTRAVLAA